MTGINHNFNNSAKARLGHIMARLGRIPEGQAVVDFLVANNIEIKFCLSGVDYAASKLTINQIRNGHYQYGACSILLNDFLSDDNLIQALVHEAQHMRHHFAGIGNPAAWLSDEEHCLLRRVQEADAQAATTRIVYLLREAGDHGPYYEVMNTQYAGMLHEFELSCALDKGALNDGTAMRAAFDRWFDNDHNKKFYDRDTVLHQIPFLKSLLWNNPGHGISPGHLDERFLTRIGALSSVNYLALPGHTAPTAPVYRADIDENIAVIPLSIVANSLDLT